VLVTLIEITEPLYRFSDKEEIVIYSRYHLFKSSRFIHLLVITLFTTLYVSCKPSASTPPALPAELNIMPTTAIPPSEMHTPIPPDTSTPSPTATVTPQDVPPMLVINAPSQGNTGERIVFDASESFDFDGDQISFSWTQIHNPDRYSGTEYITGIEVKLDSDGDSTRSFVPDWPGNYRFEVVASDIDGDTQQIIDIPVYWKGTNPITIRSISFGPFLPNSDLDYMSEILNRIAASGANFVDVIVPVHQENLASVTFLECATTWSPDVACYSYSDARLEKVIEMAHNRDLGVLLTLTLAISSWQENTFYMQPTNWNSWFENYTQVVNHYADIAEASQVEILAIGNEIPRSHVKRELWNELIDSVRSHYSGDLTYRDNSPIYSPESPFPSWDRLDYIGINFWYAATGTYHGHGSDEYHPSVQLMVDSFEKQLSNSIDPIVVQYDMPVIITELGPDGYDGSNLDPPTTNCNAKIDNQENVDYVEAALIAAFRRGWVGINVFKLQPVRNPWSPEGCTITNDMRDTPLETMISFWFTTEE